MSGKTACFLLTIILLIPVHSIGEIFKTSSFEKLQKSLKFKRDIFKKEISSGIPREVAKTPAQIQEEKQKIQEILENKVKEQYVMQNISYEGYTLKGNNFICSIKVDGEYFNASEGDLVADTITIVKISKNKLKIKVEGKELDVDIRE